MGKAAGTLPGIIERLQAKSDRPLLERCILMEDILKTVSSKDLRNVLPSLLHEIFDFDRTQYSGWHLDSVYRHQHPELFQRIRTLLGPEGLLMRLINTLQGDPYAQYEFPLQCLPAPTRLMIGEGAIPSFYANKLQMQSSNATVLILSAFELYMFHLAYALVSPSWRARNESWPVLLDFVYPVVIDDMLLYFFPCDKSSLPSSPQFVSSPVRSQGTLTHTVFPGQQQVPSPYTPHSMRPQRTLFKSSFINAQKQHQQNLPHMADQGETETWLSETFLQVLTEFWLNQNSGAGGETHSMSQTFQEHFMPSMNHVKIVRLLVKYLHHFANSTTSLVTSTYQQAVMTPLDQFKRLILPLFLQKKLYTFFRHAFERWPLDSCFRMVLETWLSYIQPWRYVDFTNRMTLDARGSETDLHRKVDDKWDQFVEDNLLFYSVFLSEFLPRIHRMDLTSPYSAYMVYRVSRIFSLPNLTNLLFKAEQEVFGSVARADMGESYLSGRPQLSMSTLSSQMIDLEGPNFQCPIFFSESMRHSIVQVVGELHQALMKVRAQQEEARIVRSSKSSGGFFASLFGSHNNNNSNRQLESTPEFKQLPVHLESAVVNFCNIFSLTVPLGVSASSSSTSIGGAASSTSLNSSVANDSMYLTDGDRRIPHCVATDQGLKLTDIGRSQLINRECRFDKFDTGDPDLLPVRSYENASLVRLLFHMCFFINSYFKSEFTSLYFRNNLIGQFACVFLTAPMTVPSDRIQSPHRRGLSSSHYQDQSGNPRISLRFLASYHNLFHLGIIYFLCSLLFGLGVLGFVFLSFCVIFLYGAILATFRHLTNKTHHKVQ